MGWSCDARAGETMEKISNACFAQSKAQNVFYAGGKVYMFEHGKENDDGSITGRIDRFTDEVGISITPEVFERRGYFYAVRAGTFRIEPDGRISRGPAFFRQVTQQ